MDGRSKQRRQSRSYSKLQQKGGECHAKGAAEAVATGPQGQGVAEAEGALHLSASQQLPLIAVAIYGAKEK